eukprot:3907916-Rhodomonas_salina.1
MPYHSTPYYPTPYPSTPYYPTRSVLCCGTSRRCLLLGFGGGSACGTEGGRGVAGAGGGGRGAAPRERGHVPAIRLRACNAMRILMWRMLLRVCYAMSSTERAYAATRVLCNARYSGSVWC